MIFFPTPMPLGSSQAPSLKKIWRFGVGVVALLAISQGLPGFAEELGGPQLPQIPRAGLSPPAAGRADFGIEPASPETHAIADWVVDAGDNHALPFILIDKAAAKAYVFDNRGKIKGASLVLLGLAHGDDSVPGIGQRKLSTIRPEERTTPAGRFVASLDRNLHGEGILWIDYDAAISLHRVITGTPKEHRAARLASTSVDDKRITFGCINVPVTFYDRIVGPSFKRSNGVVYVLPETRSALAMFGAYDVEERARARIANAGSVAAQ